MKRPRSIALLPLLACLGMWTLPANSQEEPERGVKPDKTEKVEKPQDGVPGRVPSKMQPKGPERMARPFLGVMTGPVPASLGYHLGLEEGVGLLVLEVVPGTAAVGSIEVHDVLTRFREQILVNPEQLAVLVKMSDPGSEVGLGLMRRGKEMRVEVRLGSAMMGAERGEMGSGPGMKAPGAGNPGAMMRETQERMEARMREVREEMERVRKEAERMRQEGARERGEMEERKHGGARPERPGEHLGRPGMEPKPRGGEGVSRTRVSTWVQEGFVLTLREDAEGRRLTVQKGGDTLFEGPINTEEERAQVPEEARGILGEMEAQAKGDGGSV